MGDINYTELAIALALRLLEEKETVECDYMPLITTDTEFIQYVDKFVTIIKSKNTKAMHIEVLSPLTKDNYNPIIYVNDEGECYRAHGERFYFIHYAQCILNVPKEERLVQNNDNEQIEIINEVLKNLALNS